MAKINHEVATQSTNKESSVDRIIKKYQNRRLYDTHLSQYITIEDLGKYVVEGVLFRVKDSKDDTDLTSLTLLQIFVEQESGAAKFLSEEVLRQMIITAANPQNQSAKDMLAQLFSTLEEMSKSNPFIENYQEMAKTWQQNMQNVTQQWHDFFKKS